ncbi:MAG TPA: YbaB/EbfC family nucleoid-associated protein [Trueperaceae bacterium]
MNIQKLMKEAQKAQQKMQEAQQKLAGMSVEGSAGGGMVVATANGEGTVTAVKIDPSVIDPEDADMLEDLVTAAVADAQRKAKELQESEMGQAMGGMGGLGGLGGMF